MSVCCESFFCSLNHVCNNIFITIKLNKYFRYKFFLLCLGSFLSRCFLGCFLCGSLCCCFYSCLCFLCCLFCLLNCLFCFLYYGFCFLRYNFFCFCLNLFCLNYCFCLCSFYCCLYFGCFLNWSLLHYNSLPEN